MDKIEELMAEYDGRLNFKWQHGMKEEGHLAGLILGNTIFIDDSLPFNATYPVIAEEIGHYETLGDEEILDTRDARNHAKEMKGRKWSYQRLIPLAKLKALINSSEPITAWDIAEEFDVTEDIAREAVEYYRTKGVV